MSDTTLPAEDIAWRAVPPDRRPNDNPEFAAGPPALTVGIYAMNGREVARGYLTVAADEHFAQMGCPYVLVQFGEDETGGLMRLIGLESKSDPRAMKIGSKTIIGTQLRRLVGPAGKQKYELAKVGETLVGRIPEPIMAKLRETAA